jgi:hypothetical protein
MISIEGGFYYELMSTSFIWQRGPNSTGQRWSTWQQSGLDGDLLATSWSVSGPIFSVVETIVCTVGLLVTGPYLSLH